MPDVRLAATGMDSCPASDEEDTEDELEASQNQGRARFLLPSTSRQPVSLTVGYFLPLLLSVLFIFARFKHHKLLFCNEVNKFQIFLHDQVGESHRPHFRPGLEGGSSDDELQSGGRNPDTRTGIEHRRSAEGQVINSPITGKWCLLNNIHFLCN